MAADLKDLFQNWWSGEWAKVKLWDFTPKMLGDGLRLLSEGCFSHVSADGKGPFYCISEQLRVKLRFLRFTPKQKTEIRDIILHDEAGSSPVTMSSRTTAECLRGRTVHTMRRRCFSRHGS